ncbi:MAG TPA: hypothetical protein PLR86_03240, partial [Planctomycetota bacterium]|nr:hypothetical protein [Planctomycetota bacterium]
NKESSVEKNNKESSVEKNATLAKEECINDLRSFWGTEEEIANKKSFKDNIINEIDNKINDIKLWKYKYEWHIQDQKVDTKFQQLCQQNEYCKNQINECSINAKFCINNPDSHFTNDNFHNIWEKTTNFKKVLQYIHQHLTYISHNVENKIFVQQFKIIEKLQINNEDFFLQWWCFISRYKFFRVLRYKEYVKILQEKNANPTGKDANPKEKDAEPKGGKENPKKKYEDLILEKLINRVEREAKKSENSGALFYKITLLCLKEWQKPEEVSNRKQSNEKDKGIPENTFKNLITFCNNEEYISMMQECQKISYLNKERQKTIIWEKNPALFFWVCPNIFTYLSLPICKDCDGAGIQICPDCKGTQIKNFAFYKCKCKEHASGKYVTCTHCKGRKQINLKKEVKFKTKESLQITIDCYCCNKTGQITESQKNCKKCSGMGYINQEGCPKCNSTGVIFCDKCRNTGFDLKKLELELEKSKKLELDKLKLLKELIDHLSPQKK